MHECEFPQKGRKAPPETDCVHRARQAQRARDCISLPTCMVDGTVSPHLPADVAISQRCAATKEAGYMQTFGMLGRTMKRLFSVSLLPRQHRKQRKGLMTARATESTGQGPQAQGILRHSRIDAHMWIPRQVA